MKDNRNVFFLHCKYDSDDERGGERSFVIYTTQSSLYFLLAKTRKDREFVG